MFNRRKVSYSKGFMSGLNEYDQWKLMDGYVESEAFKDKVINYYKTEDHAVRAARLLMNRNVPYVQRG